MSLAATLIGAWRRIARSWRAVLAVHVVYIALGVCLLAPLSGFLWRWLLTLSGHPLVADQDILYFLLSPVGLTATLVMSALLVAIAVLESASLMAIGAAAVLGSPITVRGAFRFAATRFVKIMMLAMWLLLRGVLIVVPFLAACGVVYWLLLTQHDINYYLSRRPPQFWVAGAAITVALLVMIAILVRKLASWSLSLPCVLFAGKSPRGALQASEQLTRGRLRQIVSVLVAWALVSLVISAIAVGIVSLLGTWTVPALMHSLRALIPMLVFLVVLGALLSVPVSAFNAGSFAYLVLGLYESAAGAVPAAALPEARPERAPQDRDSSSSGLIGLAVAAAVVALLFGGWLLRQARVEDHALVIAHRGAAGAAPENTLASIRRAIDDGADWIEIDVQETADGEVIVIHDSDFMKLAGVGLKVWDGTFDQVRTIDIGSWFSPQFAGERVPTLREVLETARDRHSRVVIELKYYGHTQHLEQRVVDIVEATGMTTNIMVMSLQQAGISKLHELRPDWTTGLLVAKAVGDLTKADADFLAVNLGMAKPRFIRAAHRAGKQVYVWTVNDPMTMSSLMSLGVDGIITDEPAMARGVLADRAGMGTAERLLMRTAVLFGRPVPQRTYRDNSP